MATLAIRQIVKEGMVVPAGASASAGGDTMPNDGKTFLKVNNAGGSPCVVTLDAIANCDQGFDHNAGGSVAAGTEEHFGPFPTKIFGSAVAITYDQVTTVDVICLRG